MAETPGASQPSLRAVLLRAPGRLRTHYAEDRTAALKAASVGEWPRDVRLDATEVAAYAGLASLVLNLDEVANKE